MFLYEKYEKVLILGPILLLQFSLFFLRIGGNSVLRFRSRSAARDNINFLTFFLLVTEFFTKLTRLISFLNGNFTFVLGIKITRTCFLTFMKILNYLLSKSKVPKI